MANGGTQAREQDRRPGVAALDFCFEPVAAVVRDRSIESVHRGAIAVVDPRGELLGAVGDPGCYILLRSSAKPFQAAALVASGVADAFALSGEELAIVAGSHSGAAEHVEVVRRLPEKAGFPASALVCGAVEHNCSGKHSGMLLLARHLGVSGVGYHQEEHPVQREIHAYVASLLDGQTRGRHEAGDAVGCTDRQGSRALFAGTDGCGVPVLGMTLREAAWLFAQLAAGATPALARVRDAMVAHPSLVAGEGRLDTELMRAAAGAIVCKAGAEGVQGIGLRDVAAARLGEGTARPGEVPEPAMAVGWAPGPGTGEPARAALRETLVAPGVVAERLQPNHARGANTMIVHTQSGDSTTTFDGRSGWSAAVDKPVTLLPFSQGGELDGARLDADLSFPGRIKQALSQWKVGFPLTAIEDRQVQPPSQGRSRKAA